VTELARWLDEARARHGIEGLTILGGEPLEQLEGVTVLAETARASGLGVIVFTGFARDEAQQLPGFAALWAAVDTLVDGRFERGLPEPRDGRRVIGSQNQRLLHRTSRYADPMLWQAVDQPVELTVRPDGSVVALGTPRDVARLRRWVR
jgi:anaerobic ribonucleoside-triphosphate reductase activating protein